MNLELLMAIVPGITWICFAMGGTEITPSIGGLKFFRREGISITLGIAAALVVVWWQALLTAAAAWGLLALSGYGSKHGWGRRLITIAGFGLIGCTVGLSFWNLFSALWFLTLYVLSNTKLTSNIFIWKIVEGSIGAFIGVQVCYSLMDFGFTWLIR
jgi:hypothetical protein